MSKTLKKRISLIGNLSRIYNYVNGEPLEEELDEKNLMECLAHLEYYHSGPLVLRARKLVRRMKNDLELLDKDLLKSDLSHNPAHLKGLNTKDKENLI